MKNLNKNIKGYLLRMSCSVFKMENKFSLIFLIIYFNILFLLDVYLYSNQMELKNLKMKPIFSYDKKNVFDISQTGRLFMCRKERRCGSLIDKKCFSHSYLGNILSIKQKNIYFLISYSC